MYTTADFDYKDVQILAFPTPEGDDTEKLNPVKIESNNTMVPWEAIFNPNSNIIVTDKTTILDKPLDQYRAEGIAKVGLKNTWVKTTFNNAATLRSIVFPALRHIIMDTQYPVVDFTIKVEALMNNSGMAQDNEWTFVKTTVNNTTFYNIDSEVTGILRATGSGFSLAFAVVNTTKASPAIDTDKIWTLHYIQSDDTYRFEGNTGGRFLYHDADGSVYTSSVLDTDVRSKWKAISTNLPLSTSKEE